MATYKAHSYVKGTTLRPSNQVEPEEGTFTLTIPDGKAVAQNDVWQFGYLGENVRVLSFEIDNSASLAASGITIDLGNGTTGDCFLDGVSFGNAGVTVVERIDGATADTSANNFADAPYVVLTTKTPIVATVVGSPSSATTSGIRTINLRLRYQYAYPESYLTGVSDVTYPLAGSKVTSDAIKLDYNGAAP